MKKIYENNGKEIEIFEKKEGDELFALFNSEEKINNIKLGKVKKVNHQIQQIQNH